MWPCENALLVNHEQKLFHLRCRSSHHASGARRGSGKADAKDAFVIAAQARERRDRQPMQGTSHVAADLKVLTARRMDLAADCTSATNRLRAWTLECFPALERVFDYSIAKNTADTAVVATQARFTSAPGEKTVAATAHILAREVTAFDGETAQINVLAEEPFREHRDAADTLGGEFIAVTGGNLAVFGSPNRLADVAGLAPVQVAATHCPESQRFYQRNRAQERSHKQAVLALA